MSSGAAGDQAFLRRPGGGVRPRIPLKRWLVLIGIGLLVYEFVFSPRGFLTLHRLRRDVQELEVKREALIEEQAALTGEKKRLESGEDLEKVAREEHGMARPGEEIYLTPVPESERSGGVRSPD